MPANLDLGNGADLLQKLKEEEGADGLVEEGKTLTDCFVDPLPHVSEANEASAKDDPHIEAFTGEKFDLYESKPHVFLVVPSGAKPRDALLHITGLVEKYGMRENDLWIRRLKVQGKWVKGKSYAFTTANAPFTSERNLLVRRGKKGSWTTLKELTKSDPEAFVAAPAVDGTPPKQDFQESTAARAEIEAGPVRVLVSWATAQKQGEDVNHLDLHVQGLHDVAVGMGGLLAGEPTDEVHLPSVRKP